MPLLPPSRNQLAGQGDLAAKASRYTSRTAFPPIAHAGVVDFKMITVWSQ